MSGADLSTVSRGVAPDHIIDHAWLALRPPEAVIRPDIPIIDPHIHLWDRPTGRYLLDDYLTDARDGHNVIGSVFVECRSMYSADLPAAFASIGEVEFANGIAAMSASGVYGDIRVCAGIVGRADLTLGDNTAALLDRLIEAAPTRLRGVRQLTAWDPSPAVRTLRQPPPQGVMASDAFRRGYALLGERGLLFDAGIYHSQLPEIAALADAFPHIPIVLDHLGGWVGIGPYGLNRDAAFAGWARDVAEVARRDNVVIKLGGFGMRTSGIPFLDEPLPPTSQDVAGFWKPHVTTCIEAFGVERCMFESNFPVDKPSFSYRTMWNSFFHMTEGASDDELRALFAGTANRVFNLGLDHFLDRKGQAELTPAMPHP